MNTCLALMARWSKNYSWFTSSMAQRPSSVRPSVVCHPSVRRQPCPFKQLLFENH